MEAVKARLEAQRDEKDDVERREPHITEQQQTTVSVTMPLLLYMSISMSMSMSMGMSMGMSMMMPCHHRASSLKGKGTSMGRGQ